MNDPRRARPGSDGAWVRARRAYVALLGDADPASALLAAGALDLRPGGDDPVDPTRPTLLSGPDDLRELRLIVETATGPGAWPAPRPAEGRVLGATVPVRRPAAVLALLLAMEGLIESRSPWGRWRSVVDSLATPVAALETLTVETVVVESQGPAATG